jgi:hypothetical protein
MEENIYKITVASRRHKEIRIIDSIESEKQKHTLAKTSVHKSASTVRTMLKISWGFFIRNHKGPRITYRITVSLRPQSISKLSRKKRDNKRMLLT